MSFSIMTFGGDTHGQYALELGIPVEGIVAKLS